MKKTWIILAIIVLILAGIFLGTIVYRNTNIAKNNKIENKTQIISETVTDECTQEWEDLQQENKLGIEANSVEEKISPNCFITLRKYYKQCKHIVNEYTEISEKLINKTKDDLQEEYPEWSIEKFSSNKIILYKEFEGECNEHYILRNNDGKISIYKINEDNIEELYEKTDIYIDFLPEKDKIDIQNGIKVNGKEELNQLIEDFE